MFDKHLVATLLGLKTPWHLRKLKLDPDNRRLDVWIGYKSTAHDWFGSHRETSLPEKIWRHLNIMDIQTWVHVTPPIGARLDALPWAGDGTLPFTRAMAAQLLSMMDSGLPLEAVCRIFDISVNDLWRYKYAIESGKADPPVAPGPTAGPYALHMPPRTLAAKPGLIDARYVFRRA